MQGASHILILNTNNCRVIKNYYKHVAYSNAVLNKTFHVMLHSIKNNEKLNSKV